MFGLCDYSCQLQTDSLMPVGFLKQSLHHSQQTCQIYSATHDLSMAYNHRGLALFDCRAFDMSYYFSFFGISFLKCLRGRMDGVCDVCTVCLLAVAAFQ